jgi:hypothetical protein
LRYFRKSWDIAFFCGYTEGDYTEGDHLLLSIKENDCVLKILKRY